MYTPEFEAWWNAADLPTAGHPATPEGHAAVKRLAWAAWRRGRELRTEEMMHHRLQPARAA